MVHSIQGGEGVGEYSLFTNEAQFGTCANYDFTERIDHVRIYHQGVEHWQWDVVNITFTDKGTLQCNHRDFFKDQQLFIGFGGWFSADICKNTTKSEPPAIKRYLDTEYNTENCVEQK